MARMHRELGSAGALGDPAKVAQVVLTVAGMAEPPLRLILGSEAYAYATAAARARAETDAAWHDFTVSTDRDDATAAQRDPLGAAPGPGPRSRAAVPDVIGIRRSGRGPRLAGRGPRTRSFCGFGRGLGDPSVIASKPDPTAHLSKTRKAGS
jgi:hypothetical protein